MCYNIVDIIPWNKVFANSIITAYVFGVFLISTLENSEDFKLDIFVQSD